MPPYFVEIEVKGRETGATNVVYAADPTAAVEPGIKAGLEICVMEDTGKNPHHTKVKAMRPLVSRVIVKKYLTPKVLLDLSM